MNSHRLHVKELPTSPTMPMELIKFSNVKLKYYLNEDISLEYVLDTEIQPSYRDWIGLYPRGWKNLLQYVTFEWIVSRPCEVALRRNILFRCRYHSQVVRIDREYQFLYINKQIEVLGHSQYFRFLPADMRKTIHWISSEKALTSNLSHHSDSLSQMITSPRPCASVMMMMEGQQKQMCLTQQQVNPRAFNSEMAIATPDVPSFVHLNTQGQMVTTCSFCKRPTDFSHIQQTFDNKVKSSAERIRNLEDRIQDLENDLEMSQMAQKRLKLAAHHSKRERLAYQKFVNELLFALSQKGIVRVIDGQGTEMLVKRVLNTGARTDVEERPPQNVVKTSHRERLLKAVIGSQEQTIRELLVRLDSTSKACCNLAMKMDLVAADQNNIEEELQEFSNTMEPMKQQMPESLIAVVPIGQGDMVVEVPEPEKGLDDKHSSMEAASINEPEEDTCEGADHAESPSHDETEPVISVGSMEQKLDKLNDEVSEKQQEFPDDTAEPVNEKTPINDNIKSPTNTKASEKPSSLVIEL